MAKKAQKSVEQKPSGVKITLLPGRTADERKPLKVWLNGVGYSVPRGKEVEVPVGVADIIRNSQAEAIVAANYLSEE